MSKNNDMGPEFNTPNCTEKYSNDIEAKTGPKTDDNTPICINVSCTEITVADVKTAIKSLNENGIKPTQVAIRKFLGRGSMSTINKYINQLKEESACLKNELKLLNLTDQEVTDKTDALVRFILKHFGECVLAKEHFYIQTMNKMEEDFKSQISALAADNDDLRQRASDSEQQAKLFKTQSTNAQSSLLALRQQLAEKEKEIEITNAQLKDKKLAFEKLMEVFESNLKNLNQAKA